MIFGFIVMLADLRTWPKEKGVKALGVVYLPVPGTESWTEASKKINSYATG